MKIGILLLQSSIEDINLALSTTDLFITEYPEHNIYLFVHPNAFESHLMSDSPKGCYVLPHQSLSSYKDKLDSIINGSVALKGSDDDSRLEYRFISLFDKLASLIRSDKTSSNERVISMFRSPNNLYWSSVYNPCDGYGSSAEQMIIAVDKHTPLNVIFKPHRLGSLELASTESKYIYDRSSKISYRPKSLVDAHFVYYAQPHEGGIPHMFKGKTVNFTMWESSRTPPSWPSAMRNYTDIWTPSEWGKNIMIESGVKNNIDVVPLGVNTDIFGFKDISTMKDVRPFKFLLYANAHWHNERKNYQLMFDAFRLAFGDRKDVELVLKVSVGDSALPRASNVRLVVGRFNTTQIHSLLHESHCFLFVSSGEGFGLPPREAMSSGIPVLISNSSAMVDIADEKYAFVVQPSGHKTPQDYPRMFGSPNQLGFLDTYKVEDVAEQMIFVFENYSEALNRAKNAADYIRGNQTYKHTAARIYELLKE